MLDWYWARNLLEYRFPSVKTTDYSSSSWSHLLREEDGAIEFWRLKDWLSSERIWELSKLVWSKVEEYNGERRRKQEKISILHWLVRTRNSLSPSSSTSFRTAIDPSLQEYGCAISLHSIINSELIPGGQNSNRERQTVFFTAVNPMDKEHKDPYKLAWYKQKTWKRHQDTMYWVDNTLLNVKDSNSIKQDVMQSSFTIHSPSLLYLESCCDGIWRNHIRESICVTSASSNDFFQRYLDERIGFRSSWKQQGHPTNPTKTKNPIIKNGETRGWTKIHPELCVNACTNCRQRRRRRSNKNGETRGWTTVHPVRGNRPWLQSTRIVTWRCERSWKILRSRARQKRSKVFLIEKHFKPKCSWITSTTHSATSRKAMFREMGNVELFEFCETIPKVQCSQCLLYWNQGIMSCTCGQFFVESESR